MYFTGLSASRKKAGKAVSRLPGERDIPYNRKRSKQLKSRCWMAYYIENGTKLRRRVNLGKLLQFAGAAVRILAQ